MNKWKMRYFKDTPIEIIDGDRGINYPKKSEFMKEGYCLFLNTGNVTKEGFNFNETDFISKERDDLLRKGKAQLKDIILTTRGTVGNVAYFGEEVPYQNIRINSGMIILRANQKELSPYFLYAYFRSELFKKQVLKITSGSAQPQLPISSLQYAIISYPPLSEQKKIAAVLSALDNKIELNNRINTELENLAKTIYDYWFVQFDFPEQNGKPYKASGGKMVYNQELKRSIPKGWEVKNLSEIADITMGQSPEGTSYNEENKGEIFFQGSTDFGWRFPSVRQYTTQPKRRANKGDILLSVRAPVGTLNIADNDCCIGRGLASLRSKWGFNSYLFYVMQYFKKIFDNHNNSGTTFGSITKDDLFMLKVVYPTQDILKNYDSIVSQYNHLILNNHNQNQQLTELRDWLLPMLMNGQVTVK